MNIELRFLQKAIEDKNFVSFSYFGKNYKKVKPISILNDILETKEKNFDIRSIKKLTILKEKF